MEPHEVEGRPLEAALLRELDSIGSATDRWSMDKEEAVPVASPPAAGSRAFKGPYGASEQRFGPAYGSYTPCL